MQKIIPFKKEIKFNENFYEIVSISLDHNLKKEENSIIGTFILSGEYKPSTTSINLEKFEYEIPFTVELNEEYKLDNCNFDIDDFYYEIKNNNILVVNIEVLVDNIEEKIINKELPRCTEIEEPIIEEKNELIEETFKSYTVYIVREGDTLEEIINKYEITKEILLEYNDLNEIKIGDKIIIPC